jgi:endo-1,4-beta-xylanase
MSDDHRPTRRSVLLGAGVATAGLVGGPRKTAASQATPQANPLPRVPLWQAAWQRGIIFGTSAATWQLEDPDYAQLLDREAAILFTEDDLLWWRLRPTPESELDFQYADQFMAFAERNK